MKNRLIYHTLIGIGLIVAWIFLVYVPLSRKQAAADEQIREAEHQLQDLRESVTLLPSFLNARDQLESNRRDLNDKLFGKSEILELFREIDIMASSHQLTLVEISPPLLELLQLEETVADTTTAPFLTLRLTLEGEYTRFGQFVSELEQADFYRQPQKCKIMGARDAAHPTRYDLDFTALLGTSGGRS